LSATRGAAHTADIFSRDPHPGNRGRWQYTGLSPDQMSGRVMSPFQRSLTTTVTTSSISKAILQRHRHREGILPAWADIRTANAQVTAICRPC